MKSDPKINSVFTTEKAPGPHLFQTIIADQVSFIALKHFLLYMTSPLPCSALLEENVGHGETPMLGHAFPDLEEVNTSIGFTGDNGNAKWATLANLG